MHHDGYPDELVVGCECAANMEEDYTAAVEREQVLKGEDQRRVGWLDRRWQLSRKGNFFLKTRDEFHVVVYPTGNTWSGRVKDLQTNEEIKSRRKYPTADEVKLASLKAILVLKKKRILRSVATKPDERL